MCGSYKGIITRVLDLNASACLAKYKIIFNNIYSNNLPYFETYPFTECLP